MSEPHGEEQEALLVGVSRVEAAVGEFRTDIAELRSYGHRNRMMAWVNVLIGAVVLAVGVIAIIAAVNASNANDAAHRNLQTQIAACQAGNDSRAQNKQLWLYVVQLATASNPHPNPTQARAISAFKDKINATFIQRDCVAANPYTSPPSP